MSFQPSPSPLGHGRKLLMYTGNENTHKKIIPLRIQFTSLVLITFNYVYFFIQN